MSENLKLKMVPWIQDLHPYQPGKPIEELAREYGLLAKDIVKLASNESPLGASKKALAAIAKEVEHLSRYPDGNAFELKTALCLMLNKEGAKVQPNQLTIGNGSSDILEFIVKVFAKENDDVIVSQHAFSIYGAVAKMVGANVIQVPAVNYGHDLSAMLQAITQNTKIIFVTNPNNPTGTWNNDKSLQKFLSNVPAHIVVLLDEAYFEYVQEEDYPNGIDYIDIYPNLVVARTFSKAYGLASLRVGYGVSHFSIADLMNRVRPPFNVDSFAQAAAVAVLSDDDYVAESLRVNNQGMAYFIQQFDILDIKYIPSVANFISFELPVEAQIVFEALLAKGVIIRPIGSYEMPYHLRVSIGTRYENERFIEALKEVCKDLSISIGGGSND
jgi:histidinol-phosphate aminotransferase